jgi:cell division ATPase FtsA
MIPIWDIEDNTHNYNDFKKNSNIAKAFIEIHQPQIEHKIEKIEAESILDAIKIVNQFPQKYIFKNNWIFDIKKKIYIFSYKDKIIILKK